MNRKTGKKEIKICDHLRNLRINLSVVFVVCGVVCLTSGCASGGWEWSATRELYGAVNPQEPMMISVNDTSEEKLQKKGRHYTKAGDYYMVEKSTWRKTREYAVLGIGLPFAVISDIVILSILSDDD